MARYFDGTSTDRLVRSSVPVNTQPLTMACWFYPIDDAFQVIMNLGANNSNNHRWSLVISDAAAGRHVRAQTRSTSNAIADTTTAFSLNTWNHACAVFNSDTNRSAYLNGGGKVTNTTNKPITAPTEYVVGNGSFATGTGCGARVFGAAVWDVALTDAEILQLANGAHPYKIRRLSLVSYHLILGASPEPDYAGGLFPLTVSGTAAIADNPPLGPFFGFDTSMPYAVAAAAAVIRSKQLNINQAVNRASTY